MYGFILYKMREILEMNKPRMEKRPGESERTNGFRLAPIFTRQKIGPQIDLNPSLNQIKPNETLEFSFCKKANELSKSPSFK